MQLRILGPLEVTRAGRVLALGGTKRRTVLAVLLLRANQVVSLDELIDAVWSETPCATAVQQVRSLVSALRQQITPLGGGSHRWPLLVTHAKGYQLSIQPGQLDLEVFDRRDLLRL